MVEQGSKQKPGTAEKIGRLGQVCCALWLAGVLAAFLVLRIFGSGTFQRLVEHHR